MIHPSILLVEDNPGDQRLTIEALKNAGVSNPPAIVVDGVDALRYLEEGDQRGDEQPDLIILDLNLPRKDGRELLAAIRSDSRFKEIPVVVLSSSDASDDIRASYDLRANCYLTKPMDLLEYYDMIRGLSRYWKSTPVHSQEALCEKSKNYSVGR